MKLSIIIPVYNVENYIDKCIDSILLQNINKNLYELIFVNDGSLDNSINIVISMLFDKNVNYRILNQSNKGVSSARNEGLLIAIGDYVLFLDSDDILNYNSLRIFLSKASSLKPIVFNYKEFTDHNSSYEVKTNECGNEVAMSGQQLLDNLLTKRLKIHLGSIFFPRASLVSNNVFFETKLVNGEDILYILNFALNFMDEFIFFNYISLFYRIRIGSATRTFNSKKFKIIDYLLDLYSRNARFKNGNFSNFIIDNVIFIGKSGTTLSNSNFLIIYKHYINKIKKYGIKISFNFYNLINNFSRFIYFNFPSIVFFIYFKLKNLRNRLRKIFDPNNS